MSKLTEILAKLWDRTYWRLRREHRKCEYCGVRWTYDDKVNFGFAFEPRIYYHSSCLTTVVEQRKRARS